MKTLALPRQTSISKGQSLGLFSLSFLGNIHLFNHPNDKKLFYSSSLVPSGEMKSLAEYAENTGNNSLPRKKSYFSGKCQGKSMKIITFKVKRNR